MDIGPVLYEECGSGSPRATQHSHAQVSGAVMDKPNRLMIQACTSTHQGAAHGNSFVRRARPLIVHG